MTNYLALRHYPIIQHQKSMDRTLGLAKRTKGPQRTAKSNFRFRGHQQYNSAMPLPNPSPSVPLQQSPSPSVAVRVLLAKPLVKIKLLFMVASFISLVLSVSLYFNGHEQQGIYVGIWVPSILSLGSLLLAGERGE